jgi:hypothetical protein
MGVGNMIDLNPWQVIDNDSQGPVVLAGHAVGDKVDIRCSIEWDISDSDTAVVMHVNEVKCLDGVHGVHGFDPYAVINELSIAADGRRVTFEAGVHSYRRKIRFRVGVLTGFDTGIPHRAYTCQDLVLDIDPGPEPVNDPWSETEGVPWQIPWANTTGKLDVETSNPTFTVRYEKWMYHEPLDDDVSVDIARCKPFHPHATEDLKPGVTHRCLEDGSGLVITPQNLRTYERYVIAVRVGNTYTILVRTHGRTSPDPVNPE